MHKNGAFLIKKKGGGGQDSHEIFTKELIHTRGYNYDTHQAKLS